MTDGPAPGAQQDVVDSTEDRLLVLGGPGTGKTRTALLLADRILEQERPGRARRVLFLTFSKAAVSELFERAPTLMTGARVDRVEVSTFHGFACAILNGFGRYSGRGTAPVTIASEAEEKLRVAAPGSLVYDAIVPAAVEVLNVDWIRERIAGRYAAIICDEYQDTGDDQDQMLELLADGRRLICLADPNQMIYDFRADVGPRRLADLRAKHPREIPLEPASHRDPSGLIPALAEALRARRTNDAAVVQALDEGRLLIAHSTDTWTDAVENIRSLRHAGHQSIGVFVSKREFVEDLARHLVDAGIQHEIAGLDAAAGEAQATLAAMANFAAGEGDFGEVRQRLAVFLTAAQAKKNPPAVAVLLLTTPTALPAPIQRHLAELETALRGAAGGTISDFFAIGARALSIFGWGHSLWRLGVRDLYGQSLRVARRPLDQETAAVLSAVAASRRSDALTSDLGFRRMPTRIMTMHQAKGREMDAVLIVHHPDDYIPNALSHSRVTFVAVSRARCMVAIQVPVTPHALYAPIAALIDPAF